MKYNTLVLAFLLSTVSSVKVSKGEDASADDLDALMDKYDDAETKKNNPKP